MSKKCISCGVELEDEAIFCDECGTRQPVQQEKEGHPSKKALQKPERQAQSDGARTRSGMGIAALVMGILSVCTLGLFFVPEILGLVFGFIAISDKTKKHALAVGGMVLSAIALAFALFIVIFFA